MKEYGSTMELLPWKLGNRLLRTPAAPLVRTLFKSRANRSAWAGFVPTAGDAEQISVRIDPGNIDASVAEAAEMLRRHGVVRLPGLVDPDDAAAAGRALRRFLEPIIEAQACDPHGEMFGCDWQTGTKRLPDFLTPPAPIATFLGDGRDRIDSGFIVLSRVETIAAREGFPAVAALLESPRFRLAERIVSELFSAGRKFYRLLLSRSALAPRMIHTDTLGEYFNMFTYLSDVDSVADGPFTYVPGSHLRRDLLTKGTFLLGAAGKRPKEYPELRDRAVPMLGPAGTVIIANQRGVHGAHPQSEGKYRAMLTMNFLSSSASEA